MANQKIWCDQDGVNIGVLRGWRLNPLSTTDRELLGGTLGNTNVGLSVFDTDLLSQFFWSGSVWVSGGSAVNNLDFIHQGDINKYLSVTEYNHFLQLVSLLPNLLISAFPEQEIILTDTDYVYTRQPKYYVSAIVIIPGEETTIKIGTSAGNNDLVYDELIETTGKLYFIPRYSTLSENIYISGLVDNTKLIIIKELLGTVGGGGGGEVPPPIEEVINFEDISPSTVTRFIYVLEDDTNNDDKTLYLYTQLTGLTRLNTI